MNILYLVSISTLYGERHCLSKRSCNRLTFIIVYVVRISWPNKETLCHVVCGACDVRPMCNPCMGGLAGRVEKRDACVLYIYRH